MHLKCSKKILVVRVPVADREAMCEVSSRTFRRQQHKCVDKIPKPLRKR